MPLVKCFPPFRELRASRLDVAVILRRCPNGRAGRARCDYAECYARPIRPAGDGISTCVDDGPFILVNEDILVAAMVPCASCA